MLFIYILFILVILMLFFIYLLSILRFTVESGGFLLYQHRCSSKFLKFLKRYLSLTLLQFSTPKYSWNNRRSVTTDFTSISKVLDPGISESLQGCTDTSTWLSVFASADTKYLVRP